MKYNVGDIFCRFGYSDYRVITEINGKYIYYRWVDDLTSTIPADIFDVLVATGTFVLINFSSENERLAFRIKMGI
jgi:hypothetical protein